MTPDPDFKDSLKIQSVTMEDKLSNGTIFNDLEQTHVMVTIIFNVK